MADIRCLICNRVNDASADRCWYCHSPLPGKHVTPVRDEQAHSTPSVPEPGDEIINEVAEQAGAAEEPLEEVPEWLARIRQLKAQERQTFHTDSAQAVDEDEVPGWLEELRGSEPENLEEKTTPKALIEDNPAIGHAPASEQIIEPIEKPKTSEAETAFSVENASQPPDHLENDQEQTPEKSLIPAVETPLDQITSPGKKTSAGPVFPIHVDDLPEWLTSETDVVDKITSPAQKPEAHAIEQDGERLEKGLLPAWLKAMRPLDVVASAIPQEALPTASEEEGVLAGISGTLQSLDLEDREIKSASNPHELEVTPSQQKNSELLYSLLHPESAGTAAPVGVTPKKGRKNLLRVIVAVIMLLSVFLPFMVQAVPAVIPVLYPKEVVEALGFIQEIPSDKPVLIVAQFEAGLAGELTWTVEPLLEHLVSRGITVALLSTNVSGFAILEEQMQRAAVNAPGYLLDEKVINLGYLPGGTVGLFSLVSNVRSTMPFSTDLKPAWVSTAIANALSISDFGAVVLLTDNPEIVRAWVEQSGRTVSPPPLIAVVSAQVAPLVQPYHDSGHIRGYIAGAAGALSYQLIRQVPGKVSNNFTSYQLAMLTAVLLIFIGGLVSLAGSSSVVKDKKGGS